MKMIRKMKPYYLLVMAIMLVLAVCFFTGREGNQYSGETEYTNGSKSIKILDIPESEAEETVLFSFIYEIQADFEKLSDVYASTEEYKILLNNLKENEQQEYYIQKYEIMYNKWLIMNTEEKSIKKKMCYFSAC